MDNPLIPTVVGSASASIIGRVFTHPLDTAKARLQAVYTESASPNRYYRGTLDVLRKTFRSEGISGLYRGFGAVIVGGTPGTVLYLCSYEVTKDHLSEVFHSSRESGSEFLVPFASGLIAETLACIIYVPVDVVKERMQVQHKEVAAIDRTVGATYKNSWDALKKISTTEGLSGIYKGYGATLLSFGPYSALYFVFYERFKYWARVRLTGRTECAMRDLEKVEIPFSWLLLCSSSASAVSAYVTSPLDMAKLRLQVQRGHATEHANQTSTAYRGVIDCLRKAFEAQGFAGLFRGAGARVIFTVPGT
jgi:hypothetical protein